MCCFVPGSAVTSETRILNADTPTGEWKVVRPREMEVEYDVRHRGDHLFIMLRDKDAPNSRLLVAPMSDPSKTTVNAAAEPCSAESFHTSAAPQNVSLAHRHRLNLL